ncbi:hypothetical protein [Paenibacillus donghaensis]|uniref:Uncharacterized protein n=1 Tax=Paenibacillus donghaensis TaxID=414771 RepID=A0A2Z2KDU8_9BACL|nr:hypothetical protein [Paenibacillus donghaensis]ASA24916.1 hypothetical protein B9T62_31680 [Paenibacillus donghaensis]
MQTITSEEHIGKLLESDQYPAAVKGYLRTEYESLQTALHHDEEQPYLMEAHGYIMAVFEFKDGNESLLASSNGLDLLNSTPEYVELVELPDGIRMYRACLMPDNECFLLIYALRGALRPELEQWFTEQSGCLAKEDF